MIIESRGSLKLHLSDSAICCGKRVWMKVRTPRKAGCNPAIKYMQTHSVGRDNAVNAARSCTWVFTKRVREWRGRGNKHGSLDSLNILCSSRPENDYFQRALGVIIITARSFANSQKQRRRSDDCFEKRNKIAVQTRRLI